MSKSGEKRQRHATGGSASTENYVNTSERDILIR